MKENSSTPTRRLDTNPHENLSLIDKLKVTYRGLMDEIRTFATQEWVDTRTNPEITETVRFIQPRYEAEASEIIEEINQIDSELDLLLESAIQKGSNPGGVVEREENGKKVRYYLKYKEGESRESQSEKEEHLKAEFLAAQIYSLFGVKVPEIRIERSPSGKLVLISKFVTSEDNPQTFTTSVDSFDEDLKNGFIIDVLIGNYDIYTNPMNLLSTKNGTYRVDNGSCLMWRARGARRNRAEISHVQSYLTNPQIEIDMYRDPRNQYWSNGVLPPFLNCQISEREIRNQVLKLREIITDETIDRILNDSELNPQNREEARNLLISRRDMLIQIYLEKKPITEQVVSEPVPGPISEPVPGPVITTKLEEEVPNTEKLLTRITPLEEYLIILNDEELKEEITKSRFYSEYLNTSEEDKRIFYETILNKLNELIKEGVEITEESIEVVYRLFSTYSNFEKVRDLPNEAFDLLSKGALEEPFLSFVNSISREKCVEILGFTNEEIELSKSILEDLEKDEEKRTFSQEEKEKIVSSLIDLYREDTKNKETINQDEIYELSQKYITILRVPGLKEKILKSGSEEFLALFEDLKIIYEKDKRFISIFDKENYLKKEDLEKDNYLDERVKNLRSFMTSVPDNNFSRDIIFNLITSINAEITLDPKLYDFTKLLEEGEREYYYRDFISSDEKKLITFFSKLITNEEELRLLIKESDTYFNKNLYGFTEITESEVLNKNEGKYDLDFFRPIIQYYKDGINFYNLELNTERELELFQLACNKKLEAGLISELFFNEYSEQDKARIINAENEAIILQIMINRVVRETDFSGYKYIYNNSELAKGYFNKIQLKIEILKLSNKLTEEQMNEVTKLVRSGLVKYLEEGIKQKKELNEIHPYEINAINIFISNLERYKTEDLQGVYKYYIQNSYQINEILEILKNSEDKDENSYVDSLVTLLRLSNYNIIQTDKLVNTYLPAINELKQNNSDVSAGDVIAKILENVFDTEEIERVYHEFYNEIWKLEPKDIKLFIRRPDIFEIFLTEAINKESYTVSYFSKFFNLLRITGEESLLDPKIDKERNKRILEKILEFSDNTNQNFYSQDTNSFLDFLKLINANEFRDSENITYLEKIVSKMISSRNPALLSNDIHYERQQKTGNEIYESFMKELLKRNLINDQFLKLILKEVLNEVNIAIDPLNENPISLAPINNFIKSIRENENTEIAINTELENYVLHLLEVLESNDLRGAKIDPNSFYELVILMKESGISNSDLYERLKKQGSNISLKQLFNFESRRIEEIIEFFELDKVNLEIISILSSGYTPDYIVAKRERLLNLVFGKENAIELLKTYIQVLELIEEHSESIQLKQNSDMLFNLAVESDNPIEKMNEFISIYADKNIPDFAKRFLIFEFTYVETKKLNNIFTRDKKSNASKKLDEDMNKYGIEFVEYTIFLDLMRTALESGEISVLDFLHTLKQGQDLIDITNSNPEMVLDENQILVLKKSLNLTLLMALKSPFIRKEQKELLQNINLDVNTMESLKNVINELSKILKLEEASNAISKVTRYYLRPLKLKNIDEAIERASLIKSEADRRNRESTEQLFVLEPGDIIKSIDNTSLSYVLNLGFFGREFVGNGESDATPLDHDAGIVPEGMRNAEFEAQYKSSAASQNIRGGGNYGAMAVIIKPGNKYKRVEQTSSDIYTYDSSTYEVVDRHVYNNHIGIRTASPSTDISAIFFPNVEGRPQVENDNNFEYDLAYIYFQVSNNGFYIPILNKKGEVIFTTSDFENFRVKKETIESLLEEEDLKIQEIFNEFEKNPFLRQLLSLDAGVSEGVSIREHTEMVMGIFENFFAKRGGFSFMDRADIRTLILFHDIGKGWAKAKEGTTSAQHEYSNKVLLETLKSIEDDPRKISLFLDIIDQDLIGECLKGIKNPEKVAREIKKLAERHALNPNELLEFLVVFYSSDAGAYTSNAGSRGGNLDFLFDLNDMSIRNQDKIQQIKSFL